ncbi:hypothetical protein LDENG_00078550 [Lucifuga dentata]|nr:hypothetical protein LDENG_00078550 [Lucifuga dentata]
MGLILKTVISLYIYAGVFCVRQMSWLPCQFIDEYVILNKDSFSETHRDAVLQFGQTGDSPVNPYVITFLVIGLKLDLQQYVEGEEAELECELHRYSTQGIQVHWPAQGPQKYNTWFRYNLKHMKGLFTITGFLRHSSTQPPAAQEDYHSWPAIKDRDTLTTTVAMVLQTRSPSLQATLASQQKLHCQFAVDHKRSNVTVEWQWQHHGEKTMLFSHASHSGQTLGNGVVLKQLKGGDASLSLPFIKMSNEGVYLCSVLVTPLFVNLAITLHIQESPHVSLNVGPTLSLLEGTEHKVVCDAEGYYPLDVEIVWYQEDPARTGQNAPLPKRLLNVLLSSHKHNHDKTFSLSAFFYLQPLLRDSGSQFTCSVSHQSLRVPIRKSFILSVDEPSSWMFNLTVGFFLVVMLIILCEMLRYLHSVWKESVKRKPY